MLAWACLPTQKPYVCLPKTALGVAALPWRRVKGPSSRWRACACWTYSTAPARAQSTDNSFGEKLRQQLRGHGCFAYDPRRPSLDFTVRHYAGEVPYCCDRFLDKNRDTLSPGAPGMPALPVSACA